MANKQVKRCLTALAGREMQIKITVGYHFMLNNSMAIKRKTVIRVDKDVEKLEPCTLLVRMKDGAAPSKNSLAFPQKVRQRTTV